MINIYIYISLFDLYWFLWYFNLNVILILNKVCLKIFPMGSEKKEWVVCGSVMFSFINLFIQKKFEVYYILLWLLFFSNFVKTGLFLILYIYLSNIFFEVSVEVLEKCMRKYYILQLYIVCILNIQWINRFWYTSFIWKQLKYVCLNILILIGTYFNCFSVLGDINEEKNLMIIHYLSF